VRARPTLRLGLLLLALCAGSVRSLADDAAPHALIAVFETARNSLPQGPLPNGLRFVLYDDGQILTRAGPSEADPDPAGRGVVYGMIGRGAAENLRREAAADLQTITRPVSGLAAAGEVGSTILDVWDGLRYRRFGASAWPCRMEGRVFAGGWQRNRADTDPQFLKVCDRLLQYKIAAPLAWSPKSVKLMLGAMANPPGRQVPWPKEWPPAPIDLKPKAAIAFCAPVSDAPETFSHGLSTARWNEIGQTALVIDPSRSAVIWDWYFDLPAPIPSVPMAPIGMDCSARG
jgi:hypothetical protein